MSSGSLVARASTWFARLLLDHPRAALALLAVSLVCALLLIPGLKFDFAPQSIYVGNDNLVDYAEEFKRTFGYDEFVVLFVLEAVGDADVLEAAPLQWQSEISQRFAALDEVRSVESLATIEAPRPRLGGLRLERLLPEGEIDDDVALRARGQFESMPLLRGNLLSHNCRLAAIPVFLEPQSRDIDAVREAVGALRRIAVDDPPPSGYRALLTGLPVLRVDIVDDLRTDQWTLIPLAAVTYLVVLGLMFRCVSGSLLPLAAVGVALTWTFATFSVTGESLNLVSNVLPVLLLIIGVSSSVQIVSCYAEEAHLHPGDQRLAAQRAISHMTPACLLAALTTAIGFVSVATARSIILRRFGWQAAVGVGYQYLCTLVTLGALFRYFAPPRHSGLHQERPGPVTRAAAVVGAAVARHPWPVIGLSALVVAVAVAGARHVRINSYNALETFRDDHPAVATLKLVERELAGVLPLEISLQAEHAGRFLEPETFHRVAAIQREVRGLDGVLASQAYTDVFREILAHWPGRRTSESDIELVPAGDTGKKRLARTDGFARQFGETLHYHEFLSSDGTRARIRLRIGEIGSAKSLELISKIEAKLAEVFPASGGIEPRVTGEAYVAAHALTTLIRDLFFSLLTASLVIFSLIALEFWSLRAGLIAALPNLVPLAITLGYMGYRGYDMNVGNVIVFTVCLGLADDNTIHFLYRFREELRRNHDVPDSIQRAFLGTGRAIVATSLLLLAGLGVLGLSQFIPTQRFAELTCVTILGNLLGVLLLLPAWLKIAWREPVIKACPSPDVTP